MRSYYVYVMASISRVLYIGMTNDLQRRVEEHKSGLIPGFTQRYKTGKLVYYETHTRPTDAIAREKELKGWLRARKIALIEADNPNWADLSWEWTARNVARVVPASSRTGGSTPLGHPERLVVIPSGASWQALNGAVKPWVNSGTLSS